VSCLVISVRVPFLSSILVGLAILLMFPLIILGALLNSLFLMGPSKWLFLIRRIWFVLRLPGSGALMALFLWIGNLFFVILLLSVGAFLILLLGF